MGNREMEKIVDRSGFFASGQEKKHVIARRAKPDVAISRIDGIATGLRPSQ